MSIRNVNSYLDYQANSTNISNGINLKKGRVKRRIIPSFYIEPNRHFYDCLENYKTNTFYENTILRNYNSNCKIMNGYKNFKKGNLAINLLKNRNFYKDKSQTEKSKFEETKNDNMFSSFLKNISHYNSYLNLTEFDNDNFENDYFKKFDNSSINQIEKFKERFQSFYKLYFKNVFNYFLSNLKKFINQKKENKKLNEINNKKETKSIPIFFQSANNFYLLKKIKNNIINPNIDNIKTNEGNINNLKQYKHNKNYINKVKPKRKLYIFNNTNNNLEDNIEKRVDIFKQKYIKKVIKLEKKDNLNSNRKKEEQSDNPNILITENVIVDLNQKDNEETLIQKKCEIDNNKSINRRDNISIINNYQILSNDTKLNININFLSFKYVNSENKKTQLNNNDFIIDNKFTITILKNILNEKEIADMNKKFNNAINIINKLVEQKKEKIIIEKIIKNKIRRDTLSYFNQFKQNILYIKQNQINKNPSNDITDPNLNIQKEEIKENNISFEQNIQNEIQNDKLNSENTDNIFNNIENEEKEDINMKTIASSKSNEPIREEQDLNKSNDDIEEKKENNVEKVEQTLNEKNNDSNNSSLDNSFDDKKDYNDNSNKSFENEFICNNVCIKESCDEEYEDCENSLNNFRTQLIAYFLFKGNENDSSFD